MIFHEKHSILMALGYLDKNMRNKSVYHNGFKFFYEVAQKTGKKEILGFIIFQGPQFFKVFKNSFWKATPYFIY